MSFALFFCVLCLALELIGFLIVACNYSSACIQAGEISTNAYVFLMFLYAVATSDLFYGTFIFYKEETAVRDFGIIYHICTLILSIAGGIALCSGLTFCGNTAQVYFVVAGIFAILAGISHALATIFIRNKLPAGTKFGKSSE